MDFGQIPTALEWARKHIWLTMGALVLGLMGYAAYSFIGHYASKVGETTNYSGFKSTMTNYAAVNRILETFLPRYHISRIGIARFHNSFLDIGANQVYSFSYESMIAAPGVQSNIEELQRVPTAAVAEILPDLFDGRPIFLWTRELDHGSMKELFVKRGVRAELFIPIFNLSDRLIGFLAVVWLNETEVPKESERKEMTQELSKIAARVGAFLSSDRR